MSGPAELIMALDRHLAEAGTAVTLRRMTDPATDVAVMAAERQGAPDELAGGVMTGSHRLVLSPTGLEDAAWQAAYALTGGQSEPAPFNPDPRWPKKGDRVILRGRLLEVMDVKPIEVLGRVVRIEVTL